MSTSLLYHAFGLRGYRYRNTIYWEGHVVFGIEPKPETLCCSVCGSQEVIRRGSVCRTFRAVPIEGEEKVAGTFICQELVIRAAEWRPNGFTSDAVGGDREWLNTSE